MTQKTETPQFKDDTQTGVYEGLIYCAEIGDWVLVIIFEEEGKWRVHYENKDPSEMMYLADSLESAISLAQVHHKNPLERLL